MFMFEKTLAGSWRYWSWIIVLLAVIALGFASYLRQLSFGLGITGMGRDVSWGLYIAQFTFLAGVAASAVMVVLPYYLYDYIAFSKITILGEFLAISAVAMCVLFIFVDMGQPARILNVLLYPAPASMMFWDLIALSGYLVLNIVITLVTLSAERKGVPPPAWIRPIILVSIPWALGTGTVTALLYNGLPGRSFWLSAILAPRFLTSAFASGPALLILLCMIMRKLAKFDAGREPIQKLAGIVTYALGAHLFFVLMEVFTVFYSGIPEPMRHFQYLFLGLDGRAALVPWTCVSAVSTPVALCLLIWPPTRKDERILALICVLVCLSLWIDKGIDLIVGGFVPSPLGVVTEYAPTVPEAAITLGIWAFGFLSLTVFYKITLSVRATLEG